MLDVREYCTSHHLRPSVETELAKMQKIVQDDFGAQIAIWGNIERAPGAEGESYDLSDQVRRFLGPAEPQSHL